jgi:hypothetical protein
VCDLEERRGAEGLGELGAQAREARVVQEDIARHLSCNALDGAGVGQPQRLSPFLVCCIDIEDSCEGARVRGVWGREDAVDSLHFGWGDVHGDRH